MIDAAVERSLNFISHFKPGIVYYKNEFIDNRNEEIDNSFVFLLLLLVLLLLT